MLYLFLILLGSNDICESDLVVKSELQLPKDKFTDTSILNLGEENVNLTLSVVNRNEPAYEANVYITHSASLSYVSRRILVGTDCHSIYLMSRLWLVMSSSCVMNDLCLVECLLFVSCQSVNSGVFK